MDYELEMRHVMIKKLITKVAVILYPLVIKNASLLLPVGTARIVCQVQLFALKYAMTVASLGQKPVTMAFSSAHLL